jgi:hypothetical protein
MAGDIRFTVVVDTATGQVAIKQFDDDVKKLGESGEKSSGLFGKLTGNITAGIAVYQAASKAVSGLTGFMKDCIGGAIEEEKAEAALISTLQITGREVDINKRHFLDYAMRMHDATLFTHEQAEASQTLLLQLTNLDRQGIDQAVKGAAGLASVLKIDLQSATMMVAKAMEGNYQALGRYGIKIQQTGDAEKDRAALLEKLVGFYKRSEDEVNTFGGSLTQLKKTYDELKESIGKAITKNEDFNTILKFTSNFMKDVSKNSEGVAGMFTKVTDGIKILNPYYANMVAFMKEVNKRYQESEKYMDTWNATASATSKQVIALSTGTAKLNVNVKDLDNFYKGLGITLKSDLVIQLRNTEGALKALTAQGQLTDSEQKKIKDTIFNLRSELGLVAPAWIATADAVNQSRLQLVSLIAIEGKAGTAAGTMAKQMKQASADVIKSNKDMFRQWQEGLEMTGQIFSQISGQMEMIAGQRYTNEMIRIDNEYKQRKAAIEHSTMSEEEKNAALEKLDAELERKRSAALRSMASADKSVALMAAIVNTAQAVTKALTAGPIIGPVLAGMIATLGAIQIKLIDSQPLPLAGGAIFKRPTYLVGEEGDEILAPVSEFPRLIKETIKETRITDTRQSQTIVIPVYIAGEKIEEIIVKTIGKTSDLGSLRVHPKAIRTR